MVFQVLPLVLFLFLWSEAHAQTTPSCVDEFDSIDFIPDPPLPPPGSVPSGDILLSTLSPESNLPIPQYNYRIDIVEIDSVCVVQGNGFAAPTCNIEVDLKFCRKAPQAVNTIPTIDAYCGIDPFFLEGRIFATGTGPKAYAITGGTGDFFGAYGELDLEYNPLDEIFTLVDLHFCYYV